MNDRVPAIEPVSLTMLIVASIVGLVALCDMQQNEAKRRAELQTEKVYLSLISRMAEMRETQERINKLLEAHRGDD